MFLLLAAGSLSACATDRSFGTSPEIEITDLSELPAPRGEAFYTIGPQQKLAIEVVGSEDLSGTFLTDEDGNIWYPLLGEVAIGDRTPSEASRLIAEGLRGQFLLDPQVRVIPEDFPPPSISIGGQVKKPGFYPAIGKSTLMRAVNQAEGLTELAEIDDVLVIRSVGGQKYIGLYNLEAIQRGNYPDPELYPNDIVTVGDSPARRRLQTILPLVPILSTAAIVIDRLGR
ncbi:MAG: polysaccharide biosynthesis/export family protein [Alphaproteobacteria bacterium]|nr:polysaccharide biosynthesis/export family protein [Alphaproteobacteria bacterium]